jgi:mRNA-degrading endonuclease RelE of RelBE toxin-antitoxin system
VKSQTLPQFWKLYDRLPKEIQRRASKAYRMWQENPDTPGLHFKRVSRTRPIYSIRIGDHYRALGMLQGDVVTWFWIGAHDEYERLLKQG